ncbi:MAG: T3SS effector HopA1 family protein [Gemmatimonadales bacterium]
MTLAGDDLRAALHSVRVHSLSSFTLLGRRHQLPGSAASSTGVPALQAALAEAIYVSLHCRVPPQGSVASGFTNWVGAQDFADRLSSANSGSGTWQAGWTARGIEADGRIVAERQGVRFWVPPGEYRPLDRVVTIDRPGEVRIPKEYFELASGFYLAHGNADDTRDAGNVIRVYWHLAPTGAELLVGLMTHHLNQAGIGFQLKVLSEPLRYHRTDPAILYLARSDYLQAMPILREVRAEIEPWLRSRVSLLVKRLAPGVGLAEDPGDGSSFGEHRGRLLAGILADPEWRALGSMAEHIAFVSSRLARDGYDLDRIYLNPGSGDDFPPLHGDQR